MKYILLTKGKCAIVDDEDYQEIITYKWHLMANRYAARRNGYRGKYIYMHQQIMEDKNIDHVDGNGLNNQKHNLRKATHRENMRNRKKQVGVLSIYKGVTFLKNRKKPWRARIKIGKREYARYSLTETEAALVYNKLATENFGKFARINIL